MPYTGRRRLTYPAKQVTQDSLMKILEAVLPTHVKNATEIEYLWNYYKGDQPILHRTKKIRDDIKNCVVENHAQEIVDFFSGYFLGEPLAYVRSGENDSAAEIDTLNEFLRMQGKAAMDKELATWMYVCGVAYRICLPDENVAILDVLDPRNTFVVYSTDIGRKPLLAATVRRLSKNKAVLAGYTDEFYFEVSLQNPYSSSILPQKITRFEPHNMGAIPIIEYDANLALMGAFEPVLGLLDAINTVESNRVDGVEQFIQSLMVIYNADLEDDVAANIRKYGLIKLKSTDMLKADIKIISEQLDQTQTQTLVDDMMDRVKSIVGMPNNAKGLGGGSSGNVGSVIMWQGWEVCEARVKDTELLFKRSERAFLRLLLRFVKLRNVADISESSIDIKSVRRQYDAVISKVQSLQGLLTAGIAPEIAIATCGLFNDPIDVTSRSAEYLKKWEVRENEPVDPRGVGGDRETAGGGGDSGGEEGRP